MLRVLRFVTAGESHGPALSAVLEGMPAGVPISFDAIDQELALRQGGYGRGRRQKIETDKARFLSGIRFGKTLGSPISLMIENKDWKNWGEAMSQVPVGADANTKRVTHPRPGHADLAGLMKYETDDARNILERASARETAMRVALGGLAQEFLKSVGIRVISYVTEIGGVRLDKEPAPESVDIEDVLRSEVYAPNDELDARMKTAIDEAKKNGDTLGGNYTVAAIGAPPGLGSHVQWDRRLSSRLAALLMSIQAHKAVEIGIGAKAASMPGSEVHDPILIEEGRIVRPSNKAGGLEGGMSNGEAIVLRATMKPIATLYKPLASIEYFSREPYKADIERSDYCAVPAASVVGRNMVALGVADAFLEKFGSDSLTEIKANYLAYLDRINWPAPTLPSDATTFSTQEVGHG